MAADSRSEMDCSRRLRDSRVWLAWESRAWCLDSRVWDFWRRECWREEKWLEVFL